jgi:hypothetical protein
MDDVPRGHVYPCLTVLFGIVIDRASRACAVVHYITIPVRMSILQLKGGGTRDPGRSNSDKRRGWRMATCGTQCLAGKTLKRCHWLVALWCFYGCVGHPVSDVGVISEDQSRRM